MSYLSEMLEKEMSEEGRRLNMKITISQEYEPLGTGERAEQGGTRLPDNGR